MILVFCLYALLASTFTLGKILLFYLPPFMLTAVRMIIAGLLLLVGYVIFVKKKQVIRPIDWLLLFALSWVHIFIPYSTEFIALQSVAPSSASLVYNLSPFFTALFSYFLFGETMTRMKWVGFALGLSGIIYFVQPHACCWTSSFDLSYVLLLTSVASASLGWVLVRMFVKYRDFSIMLINGAAMFFAGFESLAASKIFEGDVALPWAHMQNFLPLLGSIILIANVLFYNLYGYLLKKYTATFLSFVGFVTPLFTAGFDWLLLGSTINRHFFATIIIVGCGIYLFYKEELRQGYVVKH